MKKSLNSDSWVHENQDSRELKSLNLIFDEIELAEAGLRKKASDESYSEEETFDPVDFAVAQAYLKLRLLRKKENQRNQTQVLYHNYYTFEDESFSYQLTEPDPMEVFELMNFGSAESDSSSDYEGGS